MIMMVMMLGSLHFRNDLGDGSAALHGFLQLHAGQLIPGGGDNSSIGVVLFQHFHGSIQLLLGNRIRTGQDDAGSGLHLVIIELAKVLHIDLHLVGVYYGYGTAQNHIFTGNLFNSANHVGQFAHAGGFDNNAVGMVIADDLVQSLTKIAHQAAANTTGVHFRDIDTGFLQKAAVNADLTELIFDQHQFFALVAFLDHLLDQSSFTGTQETGVNINLCHSITFRSKDYIVSDFFTKDYYIMFLPDFYLKFLRLSK